MSERIDVSLYGASDYPHRRKLRQLGERESSPSGELALFCGPPVSRGAPFTHVAEQCAYWCYTETSGKYSTVIFRFVSIFHCRSLVANSITDGFYTSVTCLLPRHSFTYFGIFHLPCSQRERERERETIRSSNWSSMRRKSWSSARPQIPTAPHVCPAGWFSAAPCFTLGFAVTAAAAES